MAGTLELVATADINSSIRQQHRTLSTCCALKRTRKSSKSAIYLDSGLLFDASSESSTCMGSGLGPGGWRGKGQKRTRTQTNLVFVVVGYIGLRFFYCSVRGLGFRLFHHTLFIVDTNYDNANKHCRMAN